MEGVKLMIDGFYLNMHKCLDYYNTIYHKYYLYLHNNNNNNKIVQDYDRGKNEVFIKQILIL